MSEEIFRLNRNDKQKKPIEMLGADCDTRANAVYTLAGWIQYRQVLKYHRDFSNLFLSIGTLSLFRR